MENGYWKENVRILTVLLGIWFVVSFLLSIVFVDALDNIRFAGFRLGFWLAQQGSIYVFVILIFVYIWLMDRLDNKYRVGKKDISDEMQELTDKFKSGTEYTDSSDSNDGEQPR